MKKIILILITIVLYSCSSNNDELTKEVVINVNFKAFWGDDEISKSDFSQFKFKNEHGETLSIERLRYLVSSIMLTDKFGNSKKIAGYQLIDVGEETGRSITTKTITYNGAHTISFIFGFNSENNKSGVYQDLNTANFNVPKMMGGGYHYMQFDGKYKNTTNQEKPFNYHAIRAFKKDAKGNIELKDTSFEVSLKDLSVKNNTITINVKMDAAKWFSNNWNLNTWDTPLMPNYEAQIQMNANGKKVFSLLE